MLRSNLKSGSDADIAKAVAYGKRIKVYPLSQAANPPETMFVDAIDIVFDSTIPYDLRFFEALDRFVQREPWLERDKAMIDQLKTIGIEKGKPFKPDARRKAVLDEAAREAHAWLDMSTRRVFFAAVQRGHALGAAGVAGGGRRDDDEFRRPRRLSRRTAAASLIAMAFFSAKHLGDGPVLPDDDRGQGRQAVRWRQHAIA